MTMRETLKLVGEAVWGDDWQGKMAQALKVSTVTFGAVYAGRQRFDNEIGVLGDLLRLVQNEMAQANAARDSAQDYYHDRRRRADLLARLAHKLSETKP